MKILQLPSAWSRCPEVFGLAPGIVNGIHIILDKFAAADIKNAGVDVAVYYHGPCSH